MGKMLVISGADFSENSLPISKIEGTPGYTLTPSLGSGSFTINSEGFALIPDIVTPNAQGQFALGDYNSINTTISKIKARWNVAGSGITSFTQLFCLLSAMSEIDCKELDTTNITDFSHLFNSCSEVAEIDLSTWTSNGSLATTAYMFADCRKLKWLDVGSIVIDNISSVFYHCYVLEKVRTHLTNPTHLGYLQTALNSASAGGSSNWVQGTDSDGCIMFTPSE